ncbi:MAG: hypothetical protein R3B74_02375 [Nitrospirales bacterium]|nr:hypothetical protein [Nitrospirales bacterium]
MNTKVDFESRLKLETVQWTRLKLIEDMNPISENDYEVLEELRMVILKHGYEDRFGVCLLHKHFDINPGEAPVEVSDKVTRVSTITVVSEQECKDAWETAWAFSKDDPDIRAGRKCTVYCRGFGQTGHRRDHECYGV